MLRSLFADYVQLIYTLFEQFEQQEMAASHRGRPFTYAQKLLFRFFIIMRFRRIFRFKATPHSAGATRSYMK